jgi:glycosyltransferase involved in cell wall biosynthesis
MISVVVPAFNEEEGIRDLHQRVTAAAFAWNDDYELIVVDDGSSDGTARICEEIGARDPHLKMIGFSRNFGHPAAISAGLLHSTGDIVAVMDADLQDPPEEVVRFIEKLREGYDVVYAVRTKRKEGLFKRTGYYLYYRFLRRLATLAIPLDAGDFCVMRRAVVDALNSLPERSRFLRGLRAWVGYRQTGLVYERQARFAGETKYTLTKLMKLALDGVINFSYRPLQLLILLGVTIGILAMLAGVLFLFQYLTDTTVLGYNPRNAPGWTSLMLAVLFLAGIQLLGMGILGEYVGRLFEESKQRPLYIVRKLVNLAGPR